MKRIIDLVLGSMEFDVPLRHSRGDACGQLLGNRAAPEIQIWEPSVNQ